jgi:GT2 family glycosyltransferase
MKITGARESIVVTASPSYGGFPYASSWFFGSHRLRNARSHRGRARGGRHPDLSSSADHPRAGEALTRRPTQTAVLVDHLHGGFFPIYKSKALNHMGGFRSEMFFGFEELELGLRLRDNDYLL